MSTSRYTQSKAEAAAHAVILKSLLKRPENKLCADCKKNDPRWASLNLGVFMCIRCSGIHRGLGVHISRVRSVDLDTWSPEQIVLIQRWGNRRANAYWEAHLKSGHAPPEHKMESFIRSKYESKRWAMDGPVPEPESLDGPDDVHPASATATSLPSTSTPAARIITSNQSRNLSSPIDLLAGPPSSSNSNSFSSAPIRSSALSPPTITTAPPSLVQVASSAPPPPPPSTNAGLFDLDFNSPPPPVQSSKKDSKADILSLFASSSAVPVRNGSITQLPQSQSNQNGFGGLSSFSGLSMGNTTSQAPPASLNNHWGGNTNVAGGGDGFGDFESFSSTPATKSPPQSNNDLFSMPSMSGASTNVWGSSAATPAVSDPFDFGGGFASSNNNGAVKKSGGNDAFSDIWA